MPHPSNSGNTNKTKSTRHKQGNRNSFVAVYRSPDPFPPRLNRLMTFATGLSILSNTTQFQMGGGNIFKLNGCFDPDTTGGTHQPYGWDQMAVLYSRYVVHKCHAWFNVQNVIGNKTVLCALLVEPSTGSYVMSGNSVSDIIEKPQGHLIAMKPAGDNVVYQANWDIAVVEGITRAQMLANTEEYSALTSADPARVAKIVFGTCNSYDNTQISVQLIAKLTYSVEFYDRQTMAPSN